MKLLGIALASMVSVTLLSLARPADAALSSSLTGHTLTAPLTVYGDVSVIDSAGKTNNLLQIIEQQQTLLQQQAALLQTVNTKLQQLSAQQCAMNSSFTQSLQSLPAQLLPASSITFQHVFTPASSYANGFTGATLRCPSGSFMLGCLVNCGNAVGTSQILVGDGNSRPVGCYALCETGNQVDQNIYITCISLPQQVDLRPAATGMC
jgi:hypothetical protein